MELSTIVFIVIAVITLFPVVFVWYICIGGICIAVKSKKLVRNVREDTLKLTCSIDTDCPAGYICVNGHCVPGN